jgi:hypothetical protein
MGRKAMGGGVATEIVGTATGAKTAAVASILCLWTACTIRAWDNDGGVNRRQAIIENHVRQRECTSEEDQEGKNDLERCDTHLELLDASVKCLSRYIVPSALGTMREGSRTGMEDEEYLLTS